MLLGVAGYSSLSSGGSSEEDDDNYSDEGSDDHDSDDDNAAEQQAALRKRRRQQANDQARPCGPGAVGLPPPDFTNPSSTLGLVEMATSYEVAPRDRAAEARERQKEEDGAAELQAQAYRHFKKAKKSATSQGRTAEWRAAVQATAAQDVKVLGSGLLGMAAREGIRNTNASGGDGTWGSRPRSPPPGESIDDVGDANDGGPGPSQFPGALQRLRRRISD